MDRFDFNQLLDLLNSHVPKNEDLRQPSSGDQLLAGDPTNNRFVAHIAEAMMKAKPPFIREH